MEFLNNYFKYQNENEIVGLTPELNIICILNYFQKTDKSILILTNTLYEANKYFDSITTYTDDCLLFPMDDFVASVALAISPELKIKRLETINVLKENNHKIVVTNLLEQISNYLDEGEQFQLEATPTNGNREFYIICGMKYKPENQDGVYLWIKK